MLKSTSVEPVNSLNATTPVEDYYPWFDWLRFGLAMAVMLYHDRVLPWDKSGQFAVDVFFVLSGWLIGGILLKQTWKNLPRFYFNRAVRIWIPYYIALILLITASVLHDAITWKWAEFVGYKLLMVWNIFGSTQLASFEKMMPLQGTGNHFWSVNAEEQFYLLAPILLVLVPTWGRSVLLWAVLAMVAWFSHIYAAIVFGVLVAVAVNHWGGFHQTKVFRLSMFALFIGSAIGLYLGVNYYLLAPLCATGIVMVLAVKGTSSRFGRLAGGISYPLYLNHWIGVFVANAFLSPFGFQNTPLRPFMSIVIGIAFTTVLYWYIDRRILARRNDWYSPLRGRIVTIAAYTMVFCGFFFGFFSLLC